MKLFAPLGVVLAVLVAGPVGAGTGKGDAEIGFEFGLAELETDVIDDPGTLVVVRGGYHFTNLFQLEGYLAALDAGENVLPGFKIEYESRTFLVNSVFNFHPGPTIVPYVLVGWGFVKEEAEAIGLSSDGDHLAFRIAVGSRFFVGRHGRMAIRVEVAESESLDGDDEFSHFDLTVGLTFRLGK